MLIFADVRLLFTDYWFLWPLSLSGRRRMNPSSTRLEDFCSVGFSRINWRKFSQIFRFILHTLPYTYLFASAGNFYTFQQAGQCKNISEIV
jgi:hypothetical protein